jgi:methionyl-tRNA formyltransferase
MWAPNHHMMNKQLRIILLRSDQPHHLYLQKRLKENFNLAAVVIEPGGVQVRRVWLQRRFIDYLAFLYHGVRRSATGDARTRLEYFRALGLQRLAVPKTVYVHSINDTRVVTLLSRLEHDAVIIIGTSILRRPLLQVAGAICLNIHGGVLPSYRGNNCIFFALRNRDVSGLGATIHHVNEAIDAGDIVEVVRPSVDLTEPEELIYCKAAELAIERLIEHLKRLEAGQAIPRVANVGLQRTFKMRDRTPIQDILFQVRRYPDRRRHKRHSNSLGISNQR